MNPHRVSFDPMKEGHPDPFSQPNTIPNGWDLTDANLANHPQARAADMNGTAFEQHLRFTAGAYERPKDVV
ncbi:hypothetical protein [Anaerolinea thermophila]|uniref:hypothetical protein n=1 Tax=Anaerolinea thermophila TaxID=167964 RepID=UPI0026EB26F2|nr:hypothetical protein [Anaerolinea thermophila]